MRTDATKAESATAIAWNRRISLATNVFVMRDMTLVIGISCLVLLVFLLAISGGKDLGDIILVWAACSAFIFVLMVIACLVVMWNRMDLEFEVNAKGAGMTVGSRERKLNKLVTIIGFLSGKPGVAGAGMLAGANESVFARWQDIKKVTIYRKRKVISMKIGLLTPLRLFCTEKNFAAVERMIRENAKEAAISEK
jgi:uncharacterized membrane protein